MAKSIGAKVSKLANLHELLVDLFIQDIQLCIEESIPMSASDKAVIVSFLKNEEITATPDDDKIDAMREEFRSFQDEGRKARAMSILNSAKEESIPLS